MLRNSPHWPGRHCLVAAPGQPGFFLEGSTSPRCLCRGLFFQGRRGPGSVGSSEGPPSPRRLGPRGPGVPARLPSPPVCPTTPHGAPTSWRPLGGAAGSATTSGGGEQTRRPARHQQLNRTEPGAPPGVESRLSCVSASARVHLNLQGLSSHLCSSSAKPAKYLSFSQRAGRRAPGPGRDVQRGASGVPGPHLPGVSAPSTPAPGHRATRLLAGPQAARALPLAV